MNEHLKVSPFAVPIAESIWDMKYRLKKADGTALDQNVQDSWRRVARALAEPEQDKALWEQRFYEALSDFKYLPAGRILAGAGTGRDVTLFNCFVMGTIKDSMDGIFSGLREAALTLQQGGGIGYDFSTIRPKGALVHGVAADASGPLSFMDVWDAMCRTIMSAGNRRGAMMATLRCDHPDVEAFIEAKSERGRLTNFNLSVLVTDAFMEAVEANAEWPLQFDGKIYRSVAARALWDKIMQATYSYAEPGVIFIDRINKENNLAYAETIAATNPCGEQPLPPYGACLLGSVNLAALVTEPFTADAEIDAAGLRDLVGVAVRAMDNVVDASRFPLPAQQAEAERKRRIGLGVTGLADALVMCGLTYGSDEAVAKTEKWLSEIAKAAYLASSDLAAEKGAFPAYDAEAFLQSPSVQRLGEEVIAAIRKNGIRNALLTSIAPTGTISLYAGNVSSGIEPIFATAYSRQVIEPDGSKRKEEVVDYALTKWRSLQGDAPLPAQFVTAQDLPPEAHLKMQAAAQKWVDSSISKTINLPEDISFEDFKDVYLTAYATGCKGCTTYRPNPITGAVLSAEPEKPAKAEPAPALQAEPSPEATYYADPLHRPETLQGTTYKLRWPDSPHAMYITINDITLNAQRRPFEVFINSKNMEHYAWTVALTRMISAVFRRGGDIGFVVEELKAVFDPRGGAWMQGSYVPSILAAIGGVIEEHLQHIGMIAPNEAPISGEAHSHESCPACGHHGMLMIEGCKTCPNCGHSKCG